MVKANHDYVIKLTWDERQMIASLLDSAMASAKESRGGFSEIEYGILENAHRKVANAIPTKMSQRRRGPSKRGGLGGIRGLR